MAKYIIGKIKGYVDFYNLVDFVKSKYNFAMVTEDLNREVIAPLAECCLGAQQVNEHSDNTEYWYNMLGTVKIPHRGKNKDIGYCYDNLSVKEEVEEYRKWNLKESMETTTISIGYDTDGEKEANKSIIAEIIEHFGGGWISDDLEHYTEVKEKADFVKTKQSEKRIQVAYDVAKYYGENFSYYLEKLCEIPEKYREEAFAGIDKAYERYWSDKSCRKEEFSAKMPEFGKKDTDDKKKRTYHLAGNGGDFVEEDDKDMFVREGRGTYHLAGNDWYAVMEDGEKIMLVDTDCKTGGKELETPWSDRDWSSKEGENGQCILNYTNYIADTYFNGIKHAIMPRTVEAGAGKLENAYMWPMSKDEFDSNKVVSKKIAENSCGAVWTRTFGVNCGNYRDAWYVNGAGGDLNYSNVRRLCRVAPAFYLKKDAIDHVTKDGKIVLKPAEQKGKFVTDGSKTYRLAGNDWYAVMEDDDKVMLVDTDCKIADEKLGAPWSDGDWENKEENVNGQAILDYCNNLVDKYFGKVKHVIIPRNVDAGTCKLEDAYMWPMSKEEFERNRVVGSKIARNTGNVVWTRTLGGISNSNYRLAWYVYNNKGDLHYTVTGSVCRVAPAFYLKKSAIDHITDDGEIVLKPAEQEENNEKENLQRLVQMASYPELLSVLTILAESEAGFIITDPAGELNWKAKKRSR